MIFRKAHPPPGAVPGALVVDQKAVPSRARAILYGTAGHVERDLGGLERGEALDELERGRDPEGVLWLDVQGLGTHAVLEAIAARYALHPLALADIANAPQRPKLHPYRDMLLVVTRMVRLLAGDVLDIEQVSIVLGPGRVLTFQEHEGDVLDPVRERLRTGTGGIRERGPDFLAYSILDAIVDGYYPVIDDLGDRLEELEDRVLVESSTDVLRELGDLRGRMAGLRRVVGPQRDLVLQLERERHPLVEEETRLFLRDTLDHCLQTAEVIDSYRDLASGLMNTYLSMVGQRTNEIMKVLTLMASIFIPLSFVAGVYGMNFSHMPELRWRWGYPAALALMAAIAGGLLWLFRRRGWIGAPVDGTRVDRTD